MADPMRYDESCPSCGCLAGFHDAHPVRQRSMAGPCMRCACPAWAGVIETPQDRPGVLVRARTATVAEMPPVVVKAIVKARTAGWRVWATYASAFRKGRAAGTVIRVESVALRCWRGDWPALGPSRSLHRAVAVWERKDGGDWSAAGAWWRDPDAGRWLPVSVNEFKSRFGEVAL